MKKPKTQQLGIVLTAQLRSQLEAASRSAGHSLGEEIRQRLERTFAEDAFDLPTKNLVDDVRELTTNVRLQTGHDWHAHPAATRVLRRAIRMRLARVRPGGDDSAIDSAVFGPGELPATRLVAQGSDDPDEMAVALEAIVFHTPRSRLSADSQHAYSLLLKSSAQATKEIRRRKRDS